MISLADLKLALRVDTSDTSQDAYIPKLEVAAVAFVQRYTGRYFGPPVVDAEMVLRGSGTGELFLSDYMSAVAGVGSRAYPGDDAVEIDADAADGWSLRTDLGSTHGLRLARSGGGGWERCLEYVVTGTIGYAAGAEPADVRQAVGMLVAHWFELRIPVALGTVAPEVALTVRAMLDPYRRLA